MRAAVYHGPGDLQIEERPDPVAAADELLVRVGVSGICGTDAAEYRTGPHLYWIGDSHPASGHAGPLVPGHELVGRVESLGRDVAGFQPGDLVASGAGIWCGVCRPCVAGRENLCERYWTVGLQRDGGLAELVAVPARSCVAVDPFGLTEDAAGLAQPMAIAAHAVARGSLRVDADVLVVGAGGIGGFVTFAASRAGARVTVIERDAARRAVAARLGADRVMDPADGPAGDRSFDVVFEVSGSAPGLDHALAAVRRGGRVVLVGLQERLSQLDLRSVALGEIELVGTVAHRCPTDLPAALALLAARREGWRDIAPVAIPLEAVVDDGLVPLGNGTSGRIKTLVDPRIEVARLTRA